MFAPTPQDLEFSQLLQVLSPLQSYLWATHGGAEVDLLFFHRGRRFGIEFKYSETPKVTKFMRTALQNLHLDHLWLVHAGRHTYPLAEQITALALPEMERLQQEV